MKRELNWGVIGTGAIASDFARALAESTRCRIVDVAASTLPKARAFADRWHLVSCSGTLADMLANRAVDAVYIATPHAAHEAQSLACIAAGKHVLCEKPMTLDAPSAERVIAAADRAGVFLMEGYMYRCQPMIPALLTRLSERIIGRLCHMRADFGFKAGERTGRLFDRALGGGSVLDVGGYPVSFARLIAGVVEGVPFAEPSQVHGSVLWGTTGVDELASGLLVFSSGFTAEVTSAIRHEVGTEVVIYGEKGKVVLPDPWLPRGSRQGLESEFTILRDGYPPETVVVRAREMIYAIEAALVADTIPRQEAEWPAMSWKDSLGNMRVLDRWRAAFGPPR